jgi:hypothetical protein
MRLITDNHMEFIAWTFRQVLRAFKSSKEAGMVPAAITQDICVPFNALQDESVIRSGSLLNVVVFRRTATHRIHLL